MYFTFQIIVLILWTNVKLLQGRDLVIFSALRSLNLKYGRCLVQFRCPINIYRVNELENGFWYNGLGVEESLNHEEPFFKWTGWGKREWWVEIIIQKILNEQSGETIHDEQSVRWELRWSRPPYSDGTWAITHPLWSH